MRLCAPGARFVTYEYPSNATEIVRDGVGVDVLADRAGVFTWEWASDTIGQEFREPGKVIVTR